MNLIYWWLFISLGQRFTWNYIHSKQTAISSFKITQIDIYRHTKLPTFHISSYFFGHFIWYWIMNDPIRPLQYCFIWYNNSKWKSHIVRYIWFGFSSWKLTPLELPAEWSTRMSYQFLNQSDTLLEWLCNFWEGSKYFGNWFWLVTKIQMSCN